MTLESTRADSKPCAQQACQCAAGGLGTKHPAWFRSSVSVEFVWGVLVVIAALLLFSPVAGYGVLGWDSVKYILANDTIHTLTLTTVLDVFSTVYLWNWHPLTSLSYALDFQLFGQQFGAFHLMNVGIHIGNVFLVFLVARELARLAALAHGPWSSRLAPSTAYAMVAATLFAFHPQHIETIAWLAERKGLLVGAFLLLTTYCYLRHSCQRPATHNRYYWLAFGFYVLSCLSKPTAITWPIVLLCIDAYRIQTQFGRIVRVELLRALLDKWPFLVCSIALFAVTVLAQRSDGSELPLLALFSVKSGGNIASLADVDIATRLLNACYSIRLYFEKFFWPFDLNPLYSYPTERLHFDWFFNSLNLMFVLFLFVAAGIFYWRGKVVPLLCLVALLGTLLPVIGIVQVGLQGAADRYTYLSLIPLFLIVAYAIIWATSRRNHLSVVLGFVLAISFFGLTAYRSSEQLLVWRNNHSLWSHVNDHTPGQSGLALSRLGDIHFVRGEYEKALEYFLGAQSHGALTDLQSYFHFAESYSSLGWYSLARDVYLYADKTLPLNPTQRAYIQRRLVRLHERAADTDGADRV